MTFYDLCYDLMNIFWSQNTEAKKNLRVVEHSHGRINNLCIFYAESAHHASTFLYIDIITDALL